MLWLRKGFVQLFSVVLLSGLLVTALSTSATLSFKTPDNIKNWLDKSNIYENFVDNAIIQGKKSANSDPSNSVLISDSAVQQAAQKAFSKAQLQEYVNNFLDNNYDWLQGKTKKPEFRIDFTSAKQNYANQVGRFVQTRLTSLPICTPAQLAALGNLNSIDPLTITCRPSTLSPQVEAMMVSEQIFNNGDFLSSTVITPENINPDQNSQAQPYYEKFTNLPKYYQLAIKLPLIAGGVSALCILLIFAIAPEKRKALRRVASVSFTAGLLLIAIKIIADVAFKAIDKKVFSGKDVGLLQRSLTNFSHQAESQLVRVDLWFGIAFVAISLVCFGYILGARRSKADNKQALSGTTPATINPPTPKTRKTRPSLEPTPSTIDVSRPSAMPTPKKPVAARRTRGPSSSPQPGPVKTRKPPRLIQ